MILSLISQGDIWDDPKHTPIIQKATELLNCGGTVGATTVLAEAGLLDERIHTSNSLEYLKMVNPNYNGELYYRDVKAIVDGNMIIASSAGGLPFARTIFAKLDVFSNDTPEA